MKLAVVVTIITLRGIRYILVIFAAKPFHKIADLANPACGKKMGSAVRSKPLIVAPQICCLMRD